MKNQIVKTSLLVLLLAATLPVATFAAKNNPQAPKIKTGRPEQWVLTGNLSDHMIYINNQNSQPYNILINDKAGNVVYNKRLSGMNKAIDIQNLNEGSYTVTITSGAVTQSSKLVVL